jgi:hypothetical protein
MSDQLSVDTGRLNVAVPGLTNLSTLIETIATTLQDKIEPLGACWGDDATGQAFAAQYQPPKETLLTGLDGAQGALASTAQGVTSMVNVFDGADAQNQETAQSFTAPEESPSIDK